MYIKRNLNEIKKKSIRNTSLKFLENISKQMNWIKLMAKKNCHEIKKKKKLKYIYKHFFFHD